MDFTERECAIAAAFIQLGIVYDQTIAFEQEYQDKERDKAPQRKGGMHSLWMPYETIILKHLKLYSLGGPKKIYKNQTQVIEAIENEIGRKSLRLDSL